MTANGPEHVWALRLFEKSILKQAKYRALVGYVGDTSERDCLDLGSDNGVIIYLLEHVRDDARCVAELARILRPGGELVVNTPHVKTLSLVRPLRERLGLTDEWHGHVRPGYTRASLRALLEGGFRVEGASTYSKFFSESLDVALNYVYLRSHA